MWTRYKTVGCLGRKLVANLDDGRSSQGSLNNGHGVVESETLGQGSMVESAHDMLLIREVSLELDSGSTPHDVLERDGDGQLLAGHIREGQVLARSVHVLLGHVDAGEVGLEAELLVHGANGSNGAAVGHDGREDGEVNLAKLKWARTRLDEHLQSRPGKGGRNVGEEW